MPTIRAVNTATLAKKTSADGALGMLPSCFSIPSPNVSLDMLCGLQADGAMQISINLYESIRQYENLLPYLVFLAQLLLILTLF